MPLEIKLAILAIYGLAAVTWIIWRLQRYLMNSTEPQRPGPGWPRRTGPAGRLTERAEVRLNILAILTNLAGLLIIALVGFLQIGVELGRPNANPSSGSLSAVEELLRTRLADQEMLRQQHKELVEAIKGDRSANEPNSALYAKMVDLQAQVDALQTRLAEKSAGPVTAVPTNPIMSSLASLASVAVLLPLAACLFAALGVLQSLYSKRMINGAVYAAAATTLTAGSLLGGFTFWKDFSIVKSVDSLIKVEFKAPQDTRGRDSQALEIQLDVNLRPDNSSLAEMDCGDDLSQRIGPFDDGSAVLGENDRDKLKRIGEMLNKGRGSSRVTAIMLIGSADKRSLKPETARHFSSNEGLARARVEAVRAALNPPSGEPKVPVLGSFVGPMKTGHTVPAGDLAHDRTVQVCVLWSATVPSAGVKP
jgi:flagellar motor protein MotB